MPPISGGGPRFTVRAPKKSADVQNMLLHAGAHVGLVEARIFRRYGARTRVSSSRNACRQSQCRRHDRSHGVGFVQRHRTRRSSPRRRRGPKRARCAQRNPALLRGTGGGRRHDTDAPPSRLGRDGRCRECARRNPAERRGRYTPITRACGCFCSAEPTRIIFKEPPQAFKGKPYTKRSWQRASVARIRLECVFSSNTEPTPMRRPRSMAHQIKRR